MFKKSQGKPLPFVNVALVGLIVLVILVMVFYDKASSFGKKVGNCELKGGECVPENECTVAKLEICPEQGEVCCLSTCKARGGACRDFCTSDEERIYLAECKNNQVCCGVKGKV